jgi:hypothetical protein
VESRSTHGHVQRRPQTSARDDFVIRNLGSLPKRPALHLSAVQSSLRVLHDFQRRDRSSSANTVHGSFTDHLLPTFA